MCVCVCVFIYFYIIIINLPIINLSLTPYRNACIGRKVFIKETVKEKGGVFATATC